MTKTNKNTSASLITLTQKEHAKEKDWRKHKAPVVKKHGAMPFYLSCLIKSHMDKTRFDTCLKQQQGNVFFYILLGVVLFAALSFTVSRGMRGQTSTALSKKQIDLAVSDILSEAQDIESAVNKLRLKNISEGDICFYDARNSTVNNNSYGLVSTCSDNTYNIYRPEGGNLTYRKISEDWLDTSHSGEQGYGEWMFTNSSSVIGIGSGALNLPSSSELLGHINHLKKSVCEALNEKLGISGIPDNENYFAPTSPVQDGFIYASGQIRNADLTGFYSGCFKNSTVWDSYIFYQVLIER